MAKQTAMKQSVADSSRLQNGIIVGAIVFLAAALLVSIVVPLVPFWGLVALATQPIWVRVLLFVIAISLVLLGGRAATSLAELTSKIGSRAQKIGAAAVGLAVLAGLFIWLRSDAQVLGDGYTILAYIQKGVFYKYTETLEILLHIGLTKVLSLLIPSPELMSFRLLSALAGLLYAIGTFYLSKEMFDEIQGRMLAVASFWSIGTVALFFGYVENYAFINATIPFVFYLALRFMRGNSSIWAVLLTALLACAFHLSAISILPGVVFLLFVKNKRNALYKSRYPILITLSLIVLIVGTFVVLSEKGHVFVSLVDSVRFPYSLVSAQHLWDLFSELIMLSSFGAFLAAVVIAGRKSSGRSQERSNIPLFFLISAASTALFTFTIDPLLGTFRDWDLLAIYAVPFNAVLLSQLRFRTNMKSYYGSLAGVAAAFIVFFALPWALFNHGPQKRVLPACFEVINADVHYSTDYDNGGRMLSWAVVTAGALQEYDEAIRITERYLLSNPGSVNAMHIQCFCCAKTGKFDRALELMQKILSSDPTNAEYVYQTARLAIQIGKYDLVYQLIASVPQKGPHYPKLLGALACADFHTGKMEQAGREFVDAISMGYRDPDGYLEYAAYLDAIGLHDSSAVIRAQSDSLLAILAAER